jgi:hypothetical protein
VTRRLALATCRAYPRLADDDRLLRDALLARGVAAEPVVWDRACSSELTPTPSTVSPTA